MKPMAYYVSDDALRDIIELVRPGHFSNGDRELFRPIIDSLLYLDPYLNDQVIATAGWLSAERLG